MEFIRLMGYISGLLVIVDFAIYILAIFGRSPTFKKLTDTVSPNRVSWFIWALVGIIIVFSYREVDAQETLWFAYANAAGLTSVALISFWRGKSGATSVDLICLVGAGLAVLIWVVTDVPQIALVSALLIELFAALPTIKKSWNKPAGESALAWSFSVLASIAGLLAIDWQDTTVWIVLLPLFVLLLNTAIVTPLIREQLRVRRIEKLQKL